MSEDEHRQIVQRKIYENPSLYINTHVFNFLFRLNARFVTNTLKSSWSTITRESILKRNKESLESSIEESTIEHQLLVAKVFDYFTMFAC